MYLNQVEKNYIENNILAKEFYYGLTLFDKSQFNINVIEFENSYKKLFTKVDHFLSKIFSMPIYYSKIISIKNLKILLKSDFIIFVSESTICSALPMVLIVKLFRKNNINLFVMGLYSKKIIYKKLKFLNSIYLKIINKLVDNQFFLGKKELEIAKNFNKNKNSLKFFSF